METIQQELYCIQFNKKNMFMYKNNFVNFKILLSSKYKFVISIFLFSLTIKWFIFEPNGHQDGLQVNKLKLKSYVVVFIVA